MGRSAGATAGPGLAWLMTGNFTLEGAPFDSKQFCRPGFVASRLFEGHIYELFLVPVERVRKVAAPIKTHLLQRGKILALFHIARIDFGGGHDVQGQVLGQGVLQLSNVAGPVIPLNPLSQLSWDDFLFSRWA